MHYQNYKQWGYFTMSKKYVLGIDGGTTVKVIAAGPDEEQAVEELVKLVNSGFAV